MQEILSNETLLTGAQDSTLFAALSNDPETVLEIVQAPIVQEIFINPTTREELLRNPRSALPGRRGACSHHKQCRTTAVTL